MSVPERARGKGLARVDFYGESLAGSSLPLRAARPHPVWPAHPGRWATPLPPVRLLASPVVGTPVLEKAIQTAAHGKANCLNGPAPEAITRVLHAGCTGRQMPSLRMRPPPPRFSAIVVAVPRETRPIA